MITRVKNGINIDREPEQTIVILLKGTVDVISTDPPLENMWHVRFGTVLINPLSENIE